MTSRRAIPGRDQRISRVLQFIPGHAGGRVDSAQPVNRHIGTIQKPVGVSGAPASLREGVANDLPPSDEALRSEG